MFYPPSSVGLSIAVAVFGFGIAVAALVGAVAVGIVRLVSDGWNVHEVFDVVLGVFGMLGAAVVGLVGFRGARQRSAVRLFDDVKS